MTKRDLLLNEAFQNAPDNAIILIPNEEYKEGVDDREDVTPTVVRYINWRNVLNMW